MGFCDLFSFVLLLLSLPEVMGKLLLGNHCRDSSAAESRPGPWFWWPIFVPLLYTAVGFSPLTVSRIQLKGEEQKARTKSALNLIPTGRTPPFPGTPHRDRFGFFCINLNLTGVDKSSVPRPRWLLKLHQGVEADV